MSPSSKDCLPKEIEIWGLWRNGINLNSRIWRRRRLTFSALFLSFFPNSVTTQKGNASDKITYSLLLLSLNSAKKSMLFNRCPHTHIHICTVPKCWSKSKQKKNEPTTKSNRNRRQRIVFICLVCVRERERVVTPHPAHRFSPSYLHPVLSLSLALALVLCLSNRTLSETNTGGFSVFFSPFIFCHRFVTVVHPVDLCTIFPYN